MSEFMPHFAPVVVLLFLGTLLLMGISFLVLFYGAVRCSAFFAKLGAGAAVTIAVGYLLLLSGVSFASSEETLPPGGWKYFCEIDCHLAYSMAGAQTAASVGPEMQQVSAHGKFVVVRVKSWFDERTISAIVGMDPPSHPIAAKCSLSMTQATAIHRHLKVRPPFPESRGLPCP